VITADTLRIDFLLRGISGHVDVSISPNTDPSTLGYLLLSGGLPADFANGFPVCRATVTYPADGYAAIFGWTQMVCSMTWECHSYLCISPDAVVSRRVQAVMGFSWGFTIAGGDITVSRAAPLGPTAWDDRLDLLRASYPTWRFYGGYVSS
jgi:hypothetical protein